MNSEQDKKINEIISKFTVGDLIDRQESMRIKQLQKDFHASLLRTQISQSEPIKLFLNEIRNSIQEINYGLLEAEELSIEQRKAMRMLRGKMYEWLSFWEDSEKRTEGLSQEIDEEYKVKTT